MAFIRGVFVVALAACTYPHDVTAAFPAAPDPQAGAVDVVLASASHAMSVTINDALVVEHKATRKAHVDGVPSGPAHVRVATGGGCEAATFVEQDVSVPPGGVATVALPGPETSHSCALLLGLEYVGMNIGVVAIAIAAAFGGGAHAAGHIK
jgi:hypothetical protein